MKLLVTGCCGFIGTNFVKLVLSEHPDWIVSNLDALTYAGNRANLKEEESRSDRYFFVCGDIRNREAIDRAAALLGGKPDAVVHFAAESHVDQSILHPALFTETNVVGTVALLQAARDWGARLIQVGTDEVYGSLGEEGLFSETTPLAPNSPYSASKAAADLLALAWHHTYGCDVVVTRCSNNYGPYQFPEKLIPLALTNLMEGEKIPVYGQGLNVRDWLHVEDHCRALLLVLERGRAGEVYNIGGHNERRNIDIVRELLRLTNESEEKIEFVADRLGHDFRYAIDPTKISTELGWVPKYRFEEGLAETVEWYKAHPEWWKPLRARLNG